MKHAQFNELQKWLETTNWNVFGTLKSISGEDIPLPIARKNARSFFNNLDRLYLGSKLVSKGNRIERMVFLHQGISGQNTHFHFLAHTQSNVELFCENARCLWHKTNELNSSVLQTVIEPIISIPRATTYCLHEFNRIGADTLALDMCHKARSTPKVRPIHKFRRLLRQHDKNQEIIERALFNEAVRGT